MKAGNVKEFVIKHIPACQEGMEKYNHYFSNDAKTTKQLSIHIKIRMYTKLAKRKGSVKSKSKNAERNNGGNAPH